MPKGNGRASQDIKAIMAEGEKEAEQVVNALRLGEGEQGFNLLVPLIDTLQDLVYMLGQLIINTREDGQSNTLTNAIIAIMIPDLNALLKEILTAMAARDYVLIADLLEYELAVKLNEWQHYL
ncbi:hypothetical protein [Neomoorella thermoacetica]|uniref:hypothetical protein n=1 Tax=Neomoorella thermoacetica TaxID=1525 RepID=UPI0030CF37E4